jgi:hypothetical protein
MPNEFEQRLSRLPNDKGQRMAMSRLSDVMGLCVLWLRAAEVAFNAADIIAMASMVLRGDTCQIIGGEAPDAED